VQDHCGPVNQRFGKRFERLDPRAAGGKLNVTVKPPDSKVKTMSTATILAVAAAVLLVVMLVLPRIGTAGSSEAHQLVAAGALLVDVRTPQEYATGHLEGAINIPVQELEHRTAELGEPSRPVVLYCRSGARSGSAQRLLRERGFTAAYNLGPMSAW